MEGKKGTRKIHIHSCEHQNIFDSTKIQLGNVTLNEAYKYRTLTAINDRHILGSMCVATIIFFSRFRPATHTV